MPKSWGLIGMGTAGRWQVDLDETTKCPDAWQLTVDGPLLYLRMEVAGPSVVEGIVQFFERTYGSTVFTEFVVGKCLDHPVVNLVMIRSTDLERAKQFYNTIGLEFMRHRHGSGPEHLASEKGSVVFEIYPRKDGSDSTSSTRIGFRVPSVDAAVERLREIGVTVISPPKESPWGRRAVVDDFDGHRVELTE